MCRDVELADVEVVTIFGVKTPHGIGRKAIYVDMPPGVQTNIGGRKAPRAKLEHLLSDAGVCTPLRLDDGAVEKCGWCCARTACGGAPSQKTQSINGHEGSPTSSLRKGFGGEGTRVLIPRKALASIYVLTNN